MKTTLPRCVLPLLLLTLTASAWAEEANHTLVYGAYQHAPWLIQDEDSGALRGITPAVVAEVERRAPDLAIEIEPVPFQRALVLLKEEQVDIVASTDHPSLHVFAEPVGAFGPLKMALFTKRPIAANNLDELPPMEVGYLRGLPLSQRLASIEPMALVRVNSERSGFAAVDLGRLDGAIFAEVAYRYHATHNEWRHDELHKALSLGDQTVYAWALKGRGDEPALRRLRETLQSMIDDGTGEALMTGQGVDLRPAAD